MKLSKQRAAGGSRAGNSFRDIPFRNVICISAIFFTGALGFLLLTPHAEVRALNPEEPRPVSYGLRICSQNLFRFGEDDRPGSKRREKQKSYLVTRMHEGHCDAVALQEVIGKTKKTAQRIVDELAEALSQREGRNFSGYIGESLDESIRNGFLLADDIGTIVSRESFVRVPLPRLQPEGPPHFFKRGPLLIELKLNERNTLRSDNGRPRRSLILASFHLKSKREGWKDPSQTSFESLRMQEAEGLRAFVAAASAKHGDDAVAVVLGDRNSPPTSASAQILTGARRLAEFTSSGSCRLSPDLQPSCGAPSSAQPELVGLFAERQERNPGKYQGGSYRYKGKPELIDEILLSPKSLELVTRKDGSLSIGFRGDFYRGSDHLLTWVELGQPNKGR